MRTHTLIATVLLIATQAHADFTLLPPNSTAASAPAPLAPAVSPVNLHPEATPTSTHPATAHAQRPPASDSLLRHHIAQGFGNQIPLSFAVRQIIPLTLKISYSRGAERASLVDWRGGRPWPIVLRDVLHPFHLHAAIRKNQISISQ